MDEREDEPISCLKAPLVPVFPRCILPDPAGSGLEPTIVADRDDTLGTARYDSAPVIIAGQRYRFGRLPRIVRIGCGDAQLHA